jgi:structural maintenance of chromosomes protein 6
VYPKNVESANTELASLEKSETELIEIERQIDAVTEVSFILVQSDSFYCYINNNFIKKLQAKDHYENFMKTKVLHDIKEAEEHYRELTKSREVQFDLY